MRVIGFVAPKSGGKDASYAILKEAKIAKGKISFAGPLKEICSEVFGIPIQVLNDPILKENPMPKAVGPVTINLKHLRAIKRQLASRLSEIGENGVYLYNLDKVSGGGIEHVVLDTPRKLLQFIGTDFIRDRVFRDWHVQASFAPEALKGLDKNGIYCVTDIRFENEYEFLKKKFGDNFICYYVERPEAEAELAKATHPSELDILKVKAKLPESNIIKNTGSLEDLKKTLLALNLKNFGTSVSGATEEAKSDLEKGVWVSKKAKQKQKEAQQSE